MKKLTLKLICLAVIGAARLQAQTTTRPAEVLSASSLEAKTIGIAPKCIASTVGLISIMQEGNRVGIASGSGVLVSAEGLILTAGHVIDKPGNKLTIRFSDGRVVQGIAVGLDHATDTGLARITDQAPAGGWTYCTMAADNSAKLGEWVLATGNPGSIVLDRDPPLRLGRVTGHDAKAIDSNCALEPGDSGGPLFDLSGNVVGINSRILTSQGTYVPEEYLSMHVPISMFDTQMKELLAGANANPDVSLDSRYQRPKPVPGIGARARAALKKLAAEQDPEALKLLADEKKDGKLKPTPALMERLLKLAAQMDRDKLLSTTGPTLAAVPKSSPPSLATPATQAAASQVPTTAPVVAAIHVTVPSALRDSMKAKLRGDLLQQFPDALISDAMLNHMLDRADFNTDTQALGPVVPTESEKKEMGVIAEVGIAELGNGLSTNRTAVQAGKTSLRTLALFAPSTEAAGDCVVDIRDGTQSVLLGTIVSSDGLVVTKASDLPAAPRVALPDGRVFRAKVVGKDSSTDLALLKISATGLTAVQFTQSVQLGEWLAAPTANPNQLAVGIVSLTARLIPGTFAHFQGEQKIVLGVGFNGNSCVITTVMPGMPAERAGIKTGDDVFQLNGQPVTDHETFIGELKKAKAGDTLSIMVHRAGKDIELKPTIGEARATTQTASSIGEADNVAGGKLSKRRTNFPQAIQTDAAIWGDQCGGPLLNLHGQTVGVTIARYDRVCTFALPAKLVEETIEKLRSVH